LFANYSRSDDKIIETIIVQVSGDRDVGCPRDRRPSAPFMMSRAQVQADIEAGAMAFEDDLAAFRVFAEL
jgi:hypothetical protein